MYFVSNSTKFVVLAHAHAVKINYNLEILSKYPFCFCQSDNL